MGHILQLSVSDLGGARFNGFDLMRALDDRGRPCRMAVFDRRSDDPRVSVIGPPRARRLYERYLAPLEAYLSRPGHFGPAAWQLARGEAFRGAALVHAHVLAHGWFNLAALPQIARRVPFVWTLHDPWALTGHCVYPGSCDRWRTGCGRCPDLAIDLPLRRDRTAQLWRRKRAIYARAPMHVVVVSRWMERLVRASPMFAGTPLHRIPLGLDPSVFRPIEKAVARRALGLDPDRPTIAFRATRPSNRFKGSPEAIAALLRSTLPPGGQVLAFDQVGVCEPLRDRFALHELGWVDDPARAALAFAAADLFLMPSQAEAFGMMALEAIAVGTPALVFADTALADLIGETEGGRVVARGDVAALAAAIDDLIARPDERRRLAKRGGHVVRRDYTFDRYVLTHAALYDQVLAECRVPEAV